jgi:type IV pilus assembly protein PilB
VARLRIGELLLEAKLITREQLELGLTAQQKNGRKLGQALVELGIVSETQLTQALSQQLSVPWVSLYHIDFSRELLNLVPQELAERFCLVPVFVRRVRNQGETLYVAMDDPTHEAALAAVTESSSLPVRPMIASASDIRSAIRVYYGLPSHGLPSPPKESPVLPDARIPSAGPPEPVHPDSEAVTVELVVEEAAVSSIASAEIPHSEAPATRSSSSSIPISEEAPRSEIQIPSNHSPSEDSPAAWPTVEARSVILPKKSKMPRMVSLTLLDGTTIRLPAKPTGGTPERISGAPGAMTARDLIRTLRAVSQGADTSEILGEKVPLEAICAALLSLLLKKGLLADWEFVEELRKT